MDQGFFSFRIAQAKARAKSSVWNMVSLAQNYRAIKGKGRSNIISYHLEMVDSSRVTSIAFRIQISLASICALWNLSSAKQQISLILGAQISLYLAQKNRQADNASFPWSIFERHKICGQVLLVDLLFFDFVLREYQAEIQQKQSKTIIVSSVVLILSLKV